MIKNIVFDLGNVIVRWDPQYIVSQYVQDAALQKQLIAELFGSRHWQAYDCGAITRTDLIAKAQQTFRAAHHSTIRDLVYDWHKHAPPIAGMEPLVQNLKAQGFKIYLLSNTNRHFDEYKDTIPALRHFDDYYVSALRKLVKPDAAVYHDFLQLFGLTAEACLFIDDLAANIEGAVNIGMQGYHFDGNANALQEHIEKLVEV